MIAIFYPLGNLPVQVEPQVADRSVEGAIHIRPGSVVEFTEAEWKWIKKHERWANGLKPMVEKPEKRMKKMHEFVPPVRSKKDKKKEKK